MWRFVTLSRWRFALINNLCYRLTGSRVACDALLKKSLRFTGKPLTLLPPGLAFAWPFKGFLLNPEERSKLITVDLFAEARNAITSRNFEEADRILHQLLQHLYTAHTDGFLDTRQYVERRVRVYSELASVQLMCHRHEEAEKLLVQTVRDCHSLGVPLDDPIVIELSLKLALIYHHLGHLKEADLGFSYCIDALSPILMERDLDPENQANVTALVGMCHNYYSKFLYETGSLQSALDHAQQALALAQRLYPPDHLNCINISCDIAAILIEQSRFSEATTLLDQLVARLQPQKDGPLLSCLAHVLLQRVVLNVRRGQLEEAKEMISQVEHLLERIESSNEIRSQLDIIRKQYNLAP